MKITPETGAGVAYLFPVLAVGLFWYTFLFMGDTAHLTREATLRDFLEGPARYHYWWLALLQPLCLFMAIAHFSPIARSKSGAVALFGVGTMIAIGTWLMLDWTWAVVTTSPLLFTAQRVKWHLTTRSKADAQ